MGRKELASRSSDHRLAGGGGSGLLSAAAPTKVVAEGGRAEEGRAEEGGRLEWSLTLAFQWLRLLHASHGGFLRVYGVCILKSLRASLVVFVTKRPAGNGRAATRQSR